MTKTFTTSHLIYSVLICLHEKDTQTSAVVGVRYIWKKICDMKQNDKNIINRKTIFVKYNKYGNLRNILAEFIKGISLE